MPINQLAKGRRRKHKHRARAERADAPEPPFPPRDEDEVDNVHDSQRSLLKITERTSERMEALEKPGLLYSFKLPPSSNHTKRRLSEVVKRLGLMQTRLENKRETYLTGHADLLREMRMLDIHRRFVLDTERWLGREERLVRKQAGLVTFSISGVILVAVWIAGQAMGLWL
ncbi:hypothetical protein PG989_015573 [Apiospora arundinis]